MPEHHALLDVARRLSVHTDALTDDNATEVFAKVEGGYGKDASWDDVLKKRICLLIGRANTGKTCELALLKQRLQSAGRFAFLMPLRSLYEQRSVEALLTRNDFSAFNAWSDADTGEAIFLLDSIDEADLFHEGAFTQCLRALRDLLGDLRLQRARWVISSRPGAWSSSTVASAVRSELCPDAPVKSVSLESSATVTSLSTSAPLASDVVIAAIKPLSHRQSKRFFHEVFKVSSGVDFNVLAHNLGLTFALQSPGDLKWFAQLAEAQPAPRSRREAFGMATRRLATARKDEMTSDLDDVVSELEALSAASIFCESGLFALREAETTGGSLPLSELLGHRNFTFEKMVRALPLMSDAGLHRVKFVPENVQHFLAANWLSRRCETTAQQVALVDLFKRESLVGPIIPWHLLVCAGWLSCTLPDFRRQLLEFAPHAVLFLGDLAEMTPEEGTLALNRTFEKMAAGHPLMPHSLNLTGDDYWHIARPSLAVPLVECFRLYASHEICALHLLRIFSQRKTPGAVPALRDYFQVSEHGIRNSLLCLDALEECGSGADIEWAARAHLALVDRRPELVRTLACSLIRSNGDERLFVQLCAELKNDETGLQYHFAEAAEAAKDGGVLRYAGAVLAQLDNSHWTSVDGDDVGVNNESMAPAPTIALALLSGYLSREAVPTDSFDEVLRLLELVRSLPSRNGGYERFDEFPRLTREIPGFMRKALEVLARSLPSDEFYKLTYGDKYLYIELATVDYELVLETRAVETEPSARALLDRVLECLRPTVQEAPQPLTPRSEKRTQKFNREKAALVKDAENIRSCISLSKVTAAAMLAFETKKSSRYGQANWVTFSKLYGEDIAAAVRQGVKRLWREQPPLSDPESTNSTFHQTIAGLVGLNLELTVESGWTLLGAGEASRAFEYAAFEINQFPDWVPHLASRFPEIFDAFATKSIRSWNSSPLAKQQAAQMVERVWRDKGLPVTGVFAQAVWEALKSGAWQNEYTLARALDVVSAHAGAMEIALAVTAEERARACGAGNDALADFGIWFSLWMKLAPKRALRFLEMQQAGSDDSWKRKVVMLASHWQSTDSAALAFDSLSGQEQCQALSRLYILMFSAAPPEDDRPIVSGLQSRDARDETVRLRDSLLGRIAHIGGRAGYEVLYRLAIREDVRESEMRWLHRLAFGVAEQLAKGPAWKVPAFIDYAKRAAVPLNDPQSLWQATRQDVDEVVRNLQEGDFSPRNMLLQASERDMQLWLSRELELLARGRYRVFRERELANATTPDITAVSKIGHVVTMELKLGDDRSEPMLLSDLRRQLHDDYMQDVDSNFGLFVVMWRESEDISHRDRLHSKVAGVEQALRAEADRICVSSGGRKYLEVRCFICPTGVSPRNEEKAAAAVLRARSRISLCVQS